MPFALLRRAAKLRGYSMPSLSHKIVESADSPASKDDYIRLQGLRLVIDNSTGVPTSVRQVLKSLLVQVKPYYFDFLCSVKRRWLGMTIIDVFSEEFASRPRSYYEQAFADGRLRIEGGKTPAQADTPLNDNHRMRHFIHRHEPPVLDLPVEIVAETDELIVVHKPASIPVHVSGQYRKNTVMALLQVERPDLGRLFPVHRLDKPVSGLLLIAKTAAAANNVRTQIMDPSKVQKAYIARVLGSFPTEPVTVDKHLAWDSRSNHAFLMNDDGSLAERQSLGSVPLPSQSQQLQAKEAQTGFRLLSVSPDGKTSLVECVPRTGRTHQIRVHLSSLGFPIANDSQYGGTYKGPDQVRTHAAVARREEQKAQPICQSAVTSTAQINSQAAGHEPGLTGQEPLSGQSTNKRQKCSAAYTTSRDQRDDQCSVQQQQVQHAKTDKPEQIVVGNAQDSSQVPKADSACSADFQVPQDLQDDMCLNCPNLIPPGYPTDIHPLWLHAHSYTCDQWSFVCPMPVWAASTWGPPVEDVPGQDVKTHRD